MMRFGLLLRVESASAMAYCSAVSLPRESGNAYKYKVDGKGIIQTCSCYVYAYSEDAIFKTSGFSGEVML